MMSFEWIQKDVRLALESFWKTRDDGNGVLGGKTLDPFLKIIERVVRESGLQDAQIHTGINTAQLPGYFRPHKRWDAVVIDEGKLVAAIELKSQVGSIGNNFNNRSEEVLGSGIDLKTAIEEYAFGENTDIFTGYLIVVELSQKTLRKPKIDMKYFPVMDGFVSTKNQNLSHYRKQPDGTYPSVLGITYIERYNELCKRLVTKGLYSAAALIGAHESPRDRGNYCTLCAETSFETFILRLSNHCNVIASMKEQRSRLF
ncbi:MAG: hypothetical protein GYB21_01030 [Oceanospirillales bacterium]|nr:hypothetical protein [Oceanospirillales bacterium]